MVALVISLWNWPLRLLAVDTASADPLSQFSTLGVAGVACVAFGIAWRNAEKRLDRALDERNQATKALQDLIPVLSEMKNAVDRATEAGNAQAQATQALVDATKGMPDQQTWYRLIDIANRSPRRTT